MQVAPTSLAERRLQHIARAREVMRSTGQASLMLGEAWVARSWQRCLATGQQPQQRVAFEALSAPSARRLLDANRSLIEAAKPVLQSLSRTLHDTRYFALLANADGVVISSHGPIDRSDPRAALISRIGCDLSEARMATTAIGAALAERAPVWLHRGEHFFDSNSAYSCAGAPLFGTDGACIGMLDLTGIDAPERPELKHLVAQSARRIENALLLTHWTRPQDLLVRINWPGRSLGSLGDDADGLLCVDTDGLITASNQAARHMLPQLGQAVQVHGSEVFALPMAMLFDAADRPDGAALDVPLWSGLRLNALTARGGAGQAALRQAARPLKDIETNLIRQAVQDARGNVQQAAKTLGVSRATVYRRLGLPVGNHQK